MTRDSEGTMNGAKASYIALDEEAMTRDRADMMNNAKSSYIALDEEAMTRDRADTMNNAKSSYIALDEEAMTRDSEDTMNGAKSSYIALDEEAMTRDRENTVNGAKASYIALDEEAMTRDREDTVNGATSSYIAVDEEAMAEEPFSKAQHVGESCPTLDEEDKTRDKNASLITSKEAYTDIEKRVIKFADETATKDAIASFKGTSNYATDLNTEEIYNEADTQENIYDGVINDETFANEGNSMIGTTKLEAETYDDTMVVNTIKYEPTGSFGLKEDIYDENIVDDSSMFNGNLRQPETGLHQPGGSAYDESIFTSCNDANENGKEDIYFSADENIELSSFSGGTDNRRRNNDLVDADNFYDETSVPENAHRNDTDESQSIYEEIPAQKQSSFLQNFKNKVSWSGAMKGSKRSPLPAIPSGHTGPHTRREQRGPLNFEPIVESSQSDGTYEELPVLKA
ncbi:hypothetical protein BSL78_01433 [Apostichopus japonicus]|uniref:Uncharacterized protein n=1 Tax=Stichopus japonicus TaxID=307972 RepID=A0A2G8LN04_STIJA|nr:hypothetical protein BSL78_01433 [Apostichopus japonicus]